jgi:hypothetical protein
MALVVGASALKFVNGNPLLESLTIPSPYDNPFRAALW